MFTLPQELVAGDRYLSGHRGVEDVLVPHHVGLLDVSWAAYAGPALEEGLAGLHKVCYADRPAPGGGLPSNSIATFWLETSLKIWPENLTLQKCFITGGLDRSQNTRIMIYNRHLITAT